MVWFVCKMRLRHMCTFASENLMVKGLTAARSNPSEKYGTFIG